MKCPLILKSRYSTFEHIETVPEDCLKEECAWFLPAEQFCILIEISFQLSRLRNVLHNIEDKMPHAEQFAR